MACSQEKIVKTAAIYINKYSMFPLDEKPRLKPDQVVIDKENRDQVFVTSKGAIQGAARIHKAGFVLQKTRCIAVQFPLDKTLVDGILQYNKEEGLKDPALPEVNPGIAEYTGLGGNYTNTFLRMVAQGRVAESFCSIKVGEKWVMSLSTLREKDPAHADAVVNGCPWIILSRAMLTEEPGAAAVIQAAENMEGTCRHAKP